MADEKTEEKPVNKTDPKWWKDDPGNWKNQIDWYHAPREILMRRWDEIEKGIDIVPKEKEAEFYDTNPWQGPHENDDLYDEDLFPDWYPETDENQELTVTPDMSQEFLDRIEREQEVIVGLMDIRYEHGAGFQESVIIPVYDINFNEPEPGEITITDADLKK